MARSARPTLTEEVIDAMAHNLALGLPTDAAARLAGIAPSTFFKWQSIGRIEADLRDEGGRPNRKLDDFVYLVDRCEKGRAAFQAKALAAIHNSMENGDERSAMWLLERKHPNEWGRVSRTEVSGPNGGPVQQETTVTISDADLVDLANKISGLGPIIPT